MLLIGKIASLKTLISIKGLPVLREALILLALSRGFTSNTLRTPALLGELLSTSVIMSFPTTKTLVDSASILVGSCLLEVSPLNWAKGIPGGIRKLFSECYRKLLNNCELIYPYVH